MKTEFECEVELIALVNSALNSKPTEMQRDILKGILMGILTTTLFDMDVILSEIGNGRI